MDFIGDDVFGEKVSESKKADSDTGGSKSDSGTRHTYQVLCVEMLDQKTLTDIRRGTEKGVGIGATEFLLKVAGMR